MSRAHLVGIALVFTGLTPRVARAEAVSIAVADGFGFEADDGSGHTDPVSFTLTRTGTGALSVSLAFEGTATEGTDYASVPHAIEFAASETTRTVVLAPLPDWTAEPGDAETIVVRVVAGAGYDVPPRASVTLGIADVDSGGTGLEEREIDVEAHVLSITTPGGRAYDSATSIYTLNANGTTEFTLYVPRRKGRAPTTIRGVVVGLPGSGGRDYYDGYDVFLADRDFAYLSLTETLVQNDAAMTRDEGIEFFDDDPHDHEVDPAVTQPILDALSAFATSLGRPELANAPLLLYGHSRGALTAHLLAAHVPGRVIGFVANHWAAPILAPSEALSGVPALFLAAEYDRNFSADGARYWEAGRARGALWGWAIGWGMNHNFQGAQRLEALEFFDAIVPLRYAYRQGVVGSDPALGTVTLTAIDETTGYLGERIFESFRNPWAVSAMEQTESPNWYRDFETSNPIVAPFASFDRDERRRHPWFPNARVAALFQTRVSLGSLTMRFRSPDFATRRGLFQAGDPIRASLDVGGFPEATRVEFLANELVMGTVTAFVGDGSARHADFDYVIDTPSTVRLSARAIADDGATRISGDHGTEGALVAVIRPAEAHGNHAPTVTRIDNQACAAGASLSLDFRVADADTAAANLRVSTVSHLGAIADDIQVLGTGADRTLTISVAAGASGEGDVLVFVSDGDLVATEALRVSIDVTATTPSMELYVRPEWEILPAGVWTRPMTLHVLDSDTAPESVTLTLDPTSARIAAPNRLSLGFYGVRAIQTRKLAGDRVSQGFRLGDGTHESTASYDHDDGEPLPASRPSISDVPDVYIAPGTSNERASFRVADLETLEGSLVVRAMTSNATLLPLDGIELTHLGVVGIDRDRLVTVTPTSLAIADVDVTLVVRDEAGLEATTRFTVHVGQVRPDTPAIPAVRARSRGCAVGVARRSGSASLSALLLLATLVRRRARLRARRRHPRVDDRASQTEQP